MTLTRWTDPSLPQTLQIALFLFYMQAALAMLLGRIAIPEVALLSAGGVAAGLGIANSRRWGHRLAIAITGLGVARLALFVALDGIGTLLDPGFLIVAVIPLAMFAAVMHPLSREHVRIWFS